MKEIQIHIKLSKSFLNHDLKKTIHVKVCNIIQSNDRISVGHRRFLVKRYDCQD